MKEGLRKTGGRNNRGRITIRFRGGGHKRNYRILEKEETTGLITSIEYSPNRTAYIGKCEVYGGKEVYKIIGEQEIGTKLEVKKLKDVKVGGMVYGVAERPGQRGKIGRASGVKCIVIKQEEKTTVIRLPSKELKTLNNECTCTLGEVKINERIRRAKAGTTRRLGIRPKVRGTAMNAVDHPNGGKTGGGQSRTKWGQLAK
ncbi:MAG: 50S ribosomal protein L2 [Bacteroidetes bacterium]|nr:50S ribosomal protein L2 [Bacteroidota bacterium]